MKRLSIVLLSLMLIVAPVWAQDVTPEPAPEATAETTVVAEVTPEATPVVEAPPVVVIEQPAADYTPTYVMMLFTFGCIVLSSIGHFLQNRNIAGVVTAVGNAFTGLQKQVDDPTNAKALHKLYTDASPSTQSMIDMLLKLGDSATDLIPGSADDALVDRLQDISDGKTDPTAPAPVG